MINVAQHWDQRYINRNTPWDTGKVSTELQRIIQSYGIHPGRVLEVGCGTGINAVYLAQQGFEVTAFDVSEHAIKQARERAREANVGINFFVGDALALPDLGGPFEFIFDRGVYHILRTQRLAAYLHQLMHLTSSGTHYLTLAGNANDREHLQEGPPKVSAMELVSELGVIFDLVQLREFRFSAIADGEPFEPLGWSALWRRA